MTLEQNPTRFFLGERMDLWVVLVEWLSRIILLFLVILSVWSIGIILERRKFFKSFDRERQFDRLKKYLDKVDQSRVEQKASRFFFLLGQDLSEGLAVLGTLGSTSPFIGLLGTVFGIIVAFGELSSGKVGTDSVMFALAEALILTAIGLIVAIPAVIAFNFYQKKIKEITGDLKSRLDEMQSER